MCIMLTHSLYNSWPYSPNPNRITLVRHSLWQVLVSSSTHTHHHAPTHPRARRHATEQNSKQRASGVYATGCGKKNENRKKKQKKERKEGRKEERKKGRKEERKKTRKEENKKGRKKKKQAKHQHADDASVVGQPAILWLMGSRVSRRRGPGSSSESDDSDTDEEYRKEPSKYSSYWLDPACATWCRESRQQPRAPVASATANDDDDCVYAHCEPGDMDSTAQKSKPNVVDSTAQNTQTFDVVIVGAGMSGVSVAYYLRKKMNFTGTIAILDARGIAQHASGRNGGHCWPTANVPRMLHTFDALEKTAKELGVPFHCNGGLELLRQDADLEDYSARDLEYPCEYWDKHRIRKELPMLRRGKFKHGVFQTKAAHMSTPAFVNALFGSIADSVAFVQTRVTAINLATSSLHLGSGNQQIQAKHIVLATNAFTS